MTTRSPRLTGGRRASPNVSVDSQIGPSTRTAAAPGRGAVTGRPRPVSAAIGWPAPCPPPAGGAEGAGGGGLLVVTGKPEPASSVSKPGSAARRSRSADNPARNPARQASTALPCDPPRTG